MQHADLSACEEWGLNIRRIRISDMAIVDYGYFFLPFFLSSTLYSFYATKSVFIPVLLQFCFCHVYFFSVLFFFSFCFHAPVLFVHDVLSPLLCIYLFYNHFVVVLYCVWLHTLLDVADSVFLQFYDSWLCHYVAVLITCRCTCSLRCCSWL